MENRVNVLFVCLGNICRSPMAEAVMRHLVEQEGLDGQIRVDSAGTGDWHLGSIPHEGTRKVLQRHHISYENMKARLVIPEDKEAFQYILCMDHKNLKDVRRIFNLNDEQASNGSTKLMTFMNLLPDSGVDEVPDPYYDGRFDYVFELVEQGCKALLEQIKRGLEQG
ncbi:low molecular weight protein-tyrosine-phosphatase [Paenibacillus sp. HB172176]|uniref:low molecular weight protein-tyrosine-phosphatase n=1 Tax=Paenibacillus sp. HB172176 TaxID=2493690 RepID=UPI001439B865|nr:low molecular weight protein-tyrosine-phosphatase [Paenibacillus sp. HB172176]